MASLCPPEQMAGYLDYVKPAVTADRNRQSCYSYQKACPPCYHFPGGHRIKNHTFENDTVECRIQQEARGYVFALPNPGSRQTILGGSDNQSHSEHGATGALPASPAETENLAR